MPECCWKIRCKKAEEISECHRWVRHFWQWNSFLWDLTLGWIQSGVTASRMATPGEFDLVQVLNDVLTGTHFHSLEWTLNLELNDIIWLLQSWSLREHNSHNMEGGKLVAWHWNVMLLTVSHWNTKRELCIGVCNRVSHDSKFKHGFAVKQKC